MSSRLMHATFLLGMASIEGVGGVVMFSPTVNAQTATTLSGVVTGNVDSAATNNLLGSLAGKTSGASGLGLFPELYAGLSFDDNIYSTRANTVSDTIGMISPSLFAKIGRGGKLFTLNSGMNIARYGDHATENYSDGWLDMRGKLTLLKYGTVFGGFGVDYRHEPRGSQDAFIGTYPTRYRDTHYDLGASWTSGAWMFRVAGTASDKNYDNIENDVGWLNDLRDRRETSIGGRLTYQPNAKYGVYVQAIKNERSYRNTLDNYQYNRDSSGYRLIAGLKFMPARGLTGDLYAGRLNQQYVDGRFDPVNSPDFGLNLKWMPSPIYSVTGYVRRRIYETTLPGTPADLYTSGGVDIKRWVNGRMRLRTDFSVAQAAYPQIDRTDSLLGAGFGMDYRLSNHTFLEFNYVISGRNSNVTNESQQYYADYADSGVSVGLRRVFYPVPELPIAGRSPIPMVSDNGWAGFYGGVQSGYGAADSETTGGRGSHGVDNGNMGNTGGNGGLFAGYGMLNSRWYYGLELSISDNRAAWYHIKTKSGGREFSLAERESYEGVLRLGRVMPNGVLSYLSLGAVKTGFVTDYDVSGYPSSTVKNRLLGVVYGIGMDLPLSRHLFARLGYQYSAYPNYDVTYSDGTSLQTETFHNTQSLFIMGMGLHAANQSIPRYHPRLKGFYAGIQLGNADLNTRLSADQTDSGPVYSHLNSDFGRTGLDSGVFVGYGDLILRNLYLGIEGGVNDSHIGWQHVRTPTGRVFSVDMNASAYTDLKLGYLLENGSLLYVGAGVARARFNTQYKKGENTSAWIDADEMKTGTLVNVGCRLPVNSDMFIRFDYDYEIYPDYGFTTTQANSDTANFKNKLSLFTIGLGWAI